MTTSNLYRKSMTSVCGMALALFLSSPALSTITYTGALTAGGITSNYEITTDGTIGALTVGNINSWGVAMSGPGGVTSFANQPGTTFLSGTSLSATATDLLFNYGVSGVNSLQLCSFNCVSFLDFETNDALNGDVYAMRIGGGAVQGMSQSGIQSIASVPGEPIGAVPEPGTWATMLLGFGAIGFSVRRRRKALGIAQIA